MRMLNLELILQYFAGLIDAGVIYSKYLRMATR